MRVSAPRRLRIERDEVLGPNNAIVQYGAPHTVGWHIIAYVSPEIELNSPTNQSYAASN